MRSSLVWRNFLLKYEHRIKDKKLHDKEQKIYTDFFYYYYFLRFKRTFTYNFSINFWQKEILKKIMQKQNK